MPGDEGAHGTPIEWWYFNGHLSDQAGKTYSYHFVTFQIKTSSGFTPQLLQLSWGDTGQADVLTEEKINFQAGPATPGRFDVQAAGWEMHGDGDSYRLMFNTAGYSLDLKATSSKPAVLHNRVGLVDLGLAGSSYYYSRTRLRVTGTLAIADGLPQEVAGIAWMDHQWGDFSTISIGWDWSSLQFDDRSELMVSMVWEPSSRKPVASYGTYVAPDGSVKHLSAAEITLKPTGSWQSRVTGAVYPMGWKLAVAPLGLDVALTPVHQKSEFANSSYVPVAYWEGAVTVSGAKEGQSATGKGFVEMVGYDPRQTISGTPRPP